EEEVELFYGNSFVLGGALANLIQNSVNYTPEQGTIKISAGKEDDQLILVIKDSGIGIPKEDIKHILGEFYRGSNVKSIVGSGLGLSFVRQVAENHGGTVSIDSELGKGTIIQMILPVIEKESREKSA
nr:sensor histidine kinase [Bacteroidota bacterium]